MDDVITLSSDDSDVEIVDSFSTKVEPPPPPPPPLSSVRVDVDAVNVNIPPHFIDLTDPSWISPEQKKCKRQNSTSLEVVDLTECDAANGTEQETLLPSSTKNQTSSREDFNLQKTSFGDLTVLAPQLDCGDRKPNMSYLDSQTQNQKQDDEVRPSDQTPTVKLRRLPFLETHCRELETSGCFAYLTVDCTQMLPSFKQLDIKSNAPERISNVGTTIASSVPCMEPSLDECSPAVAKYLIEQEQQENSNEFTSTHLRHISYHSPITRLSPSEPFDIDSLPHRSPASSDHQSQVEPPAMSEHTPAENAYECQLDKAKAERTSENPDLLCSRVPSEPLLYVSKTEDTDGGSGYEVYRGDLDNDSPLSFPWHEGSDEANEESRFDVDFRAASEEDRHSVCPVTLRKIMSGPCQALIEVVDEEYGTPEVLCRQSLSLVYSTIDEDYPEGTLQLLSDLVMPGYYPPRDIMIHLLCNILLNQKCPHHLCVQAFSLLMRAQKHHMADKTTVPWDWELLTSVLANQDCTKRHQCEVVRMFLEYVVETLKDDFQAKRSVSALNYSITKATLSCDQQFPRVRDVIKWLFSAIMKSTEYGESRETVRERDEQIRMVSVFQRMLSLALEVDRSPALNSVKLSQELFHMLISNVPLRAHRMLLLESLQSKLLRCKLLEHLLDYACPLKISLPMSLSLLLHFLKNCTLAPDPTDGTERWQRWEELVHLLWMLLLSYNTEMKGDLCSSVSEQRGGVGTMIHKPDDKVSKSAIREAVDAFLSRSQADLGQALPLHVEESLSYLQDHLLDVCQC